MSADSGEKQTDNGSNEEYVPKADLDKVRSAEQKRAAAATKDAEEAKKRAEDAEKRATEAQKSLEQAKLQGMSDEEKAKYERIIERESSLAEKERDIQNRENEANKKLLEAERSRIAAQYAGYVSSEDLEQYSSASEMEYAAIKAKADALEAKVNGNSGAKGESKDADSGQSKDSGEDNASSKRGTYDTAEGSSTSDPLKGVGPMDLLAQGYGRKRS